MLRKLGKVLHISPHKMLIVRSTFAPEIGSTIVTKDMKDVGEVFDVFGPVSNPYVSVKPKSDVNLETLIGETLYVMEKEVKKRAEERRRTSRRRQK